MALGHDSLGFLLADVTRLMRQRFGSLQTAIGLTLAESRALIYIARNEGIRQVDLAEILEIKPITLTRLIDKLEAEGLVQRCKVPEDRRAFKLRLTPRAASTIAATESTAAKVRALALEGFGPEEASAVIAALRRMRANLCESCESGS